MENEQPTQSQDVKSESPQAAPPAPPVLHASEKDRTKEYLAVLIVVGAALALAIWYMSREPSVEQMPVFSPGTVQAPVEPDIAALQSQSSSDSVSAIENDLNATDLEDLDHEMQVIEQELGF